LAVRKDKALRGDGAAGSCPIGWARVESCSVVEDVIEVGCGIINHCFLRLAARISPPQLSQIDFSVLVVGILFE